MIAQWSLLEIKCPDSSQKVGKRGVRKLVTTSTDWIGVFVDVLFQADEYCMTSSKSSINDKKMVWNNPIFDGYQLHLHGQCPTTFVVGLDACAVGEIFF